MMRLVKVSGRFSSVSDTSWTHTQPLPGVHSRNTSPSARHPHTGIVLSTAHPAKFHHLLDEAMRQQVRVPEALSRLRPEMKRSIRLSARFDEFKEFLLQS